MRLLIIEDDKDLCETISRQLNNQGYYVDTCHSGEDALLYALQYEYDIIVLDRMLPVLDGLSITEVIRNKKIHTPIIMVTAMGEISDKVEGLDAGADDYLVKPFSIDELLARIRALIRRPSKMENTEVLSLSDLLLDRNNKMLICRGKTLSLSKKETDLLSFLIVHNNAPVSRERMLTHVWGVDAAVEMGNLDNYIYFLRRRLKNIGSKVSIKTIYGVGYKLEEEK